MGRVITVDFRWPPSADTELKLFCRRRVDGPPGISMRERDAVFFPSLCGPSSQGKSWPTDKGTPFNFPRGNTRFESRRVVRALAHVLRTDDGASLTLSRDDCVGRPERDGPRVSCEQRRGGKACSTLRRDRS